MSKSILVSSAGKDVHNGGIAFALTAEVDSDQKQICLYFASGVDNFGVSSTSTISGLDVEDLRQLGKLFLASAEKVEYIMKTENLTFADSDDEDMEIKVNGQTT